MMEGRHANDHGAAAGFEAPQLKKVLVCTPRARFKSLFYPLATSSSGRPKLVAW